MADPETNRRFLRLRLHAVRLDSNEMARISRFFIACCQALSIEPRKDQHSVARVVFCEHDGFGKSVEFLESTLRRVLMGHRQIATLQDAQRTYLIRGRDDEVTPTQTNEPKIWVCALTLETEVRLLYAPCSKRNLTFPDHVRNFQNQGLELNQTFRQSINPHPHLLQTQHIVQSWSGATKSVIFAAGHLPFPS